MYMHGTSQKSNNPSGINYFANRFPFQSRASKACKAQRRQSRPPASQQHSQSGCLGFRTCVVAWVKISQMLCTEQTSYFNCCCISGRLTKQVAANCSKYGARSVFSHSTSQCSWPMRSQHGHSVSQRVLFSKLMASLKLCTVRICNLYCVHGSRFVLCSA